MKLGRWLVRMLAVGSVGCGGASSGFETSADAGSEIATDGAANDARDAGDASDVETDAGDAGTDTVALDAVDHGTDGDGIDVSLDTGAADASDARDASGGDVAPDLFARDAGALDAPVDVAADTGVVDAPGETVGGGVGTPCATASECMAGLFCCYPCGIPGCHDVCTVPMMGRCPLVP